MPGGRKTIGGGLQTQDDRGGADVLGETKGAGRVRGLQEGDGSRFAGNPLDDTTWEGESGQVELEQSSHRRRIKSNISDRVTDQGSEEGIPSGGLPRKGRDTDGDEGSFLAPACPGHRDHLGGGKPPTPKVLTMKHAGNMVDPQWET